MDKLEFKKMYDEEMRKLSEVENAVNGLGFQMNGKISSHKRAKSAFERYADEHKTNGCGGFYYGYVANIAAQNWNSFMEVCFQLWNFSRMSKDSLKQFYWYIESAFEMVEEGTFTFEDYRDEQFQVYMTNLDKFFGREKCEEIWNYFIDYLKNKGDWQDFDC